MSEAFNIAQTIAEQIGIRCLMALGVPRRSYVIIKPDDKCLGGLSFAFTNCPKIRSGRVFVRLMPSDTYTVTIYSTNGLHVLHESSDVYCDDLAALLEEVIG